MARWRLKRNCSLTPRQALGAWALPLLALLCVAGFAAVQGWWWVAGFALFDIACLVAALGVYSRHALDGETVVLGDDGMLRIEQQRGQRLLCVAWPAPLVRMEAAAGEPISVWAGRERLELGVHATPQARDRAALELGCALKLDGHRVPRL